MKAGSGALFRIVGSDAVIYPNVDGRFTFSSATCEAINASLRGPLGARCSRPEEASTPGRISRARREAYSKP